MFNIYYKNKKDNEIKEVISDLDKDSYNVPKKFIEDNIRMCEYNIQNCKNIFKKRKLLKKKEKLQKKLEELSNK